MKVGFVSSLYSPNVVGGAERVVQALAESLVDAGHDAFVVTAAEEPGVRTAFVNGVRVYYVGNRNLYWPFRPEGRPSHLKPLWHAIDTFNVAMAHEVGRILTDQRPEVLHTHGLMGFSPLVWRAAKRRQIPVVHTLHDYYLLCPRATLFRDGTNCIRRHLDCRLYSVPRLHATRHVDAVVGVSRYILDRHLGDGAFASVSRRHVIHNMRTDAPASHKPWPELRSQALGDAGRRPLRIGFIGQLVPLKGIELLLEETLLLPHDAWRLKIAGRGYPPEYEAGLRAQYASERVEFVGFAEPTAFFREIDVLVVPSLWQEPMGLVIIESRAHGVPVIASRRGGMPELLEDGRNGWLFDPSLPGALAARLRQLIANPSLVTAAASCTAEGLSAFAVSGVRAKYEEVYRTLLPT